MKYIFIGLDLESTGKRTYDDEITQVGIGFVYEMKVLEGFETLVKCKKKICEEAVLITGIRNEDLIYAPTFLETLPLITDHINETCDPLGDIDRVLTAYNGNNFDIPLFVHELRRNGKDPVAYLRQWKITYLCDPFIIAKNVLDTTLLQQNERGQPNYKLGCVYEAFFKKTFKNAHSALADVNAMLDLITKNQTLLLPIEQDLEIKVKKYLVDLISFVQDIKTAKSSKRPISVMNTSMMTSFLSKHSKKQ